MKRYIKVTLWTLGAVTVLLIAAAIVVLLVFDPNKYKTEIAAAVQKTTGRELTIQGDLKLSLFPWLGVETGAMTLSNPPGFGKEPFAKIGAAAIKVKLLPLLKSEVEVDTVTLDGLYLHLIRGPTGRANWGWKRLADLQNGETEAAPAANSGSAAPTLTSLAIGGIRLKDATVIWDDRQNHTRYELNKLALRTGPVSLRSPVTLDLDTEVSSRAPVLSAHLALNTRALFDFAAQRLQLNGLKLSVQARAQGLPADEAKLTLSSDAVLKLAERHYQLTGLQLLASLHGEQLPGKQLEAKLHGDVVVDLNKDILAIEPLSIEAWNLKVDGRVRGEDLLKSPRFSGSLTVPDFSARELLGRIGAAPPVTADDKALSKVSAKLQFKASTTDAELSGLEINLDQTRITGKAAIKNFTPPAYRMQLAVDDIDADRYLPPPTKDTTPVTPATAAGAGAAELPLETLRALDVDGGLTIGKLKIAKLTVNDIKLGVNAKAGVIRAHPLSAHLYGGTYGGDMQLDARGKAAKISVNEHLNRIKIGPLTKDLLDKDLVAGTGNIRMKLSATGLDPEKIKRTLKGNLGFSFDKGRVNGVNLIEMIQKDYLKYIQGLAIDAGQLNQTVFSKFAASATVNNGLIDTKDLVLDSAQLNVKGRGTVNLVDERLALHLDALPRGQLAKELGKFRNTMIPIRVEGTLRAPKFATDLDDLLKRKAKARLEKEKQKLEAELREKTEKEKAKLQQKLDAQKKEQQQKLEKELQDKLKGMFK